MPERETDQLNIKIDARLKHDFADRAQKSGKPQREIVEMLIMAWLAGNEDQAVRHLNGELCPLSKLINALSDEVRAYSAGKLTYEPRTPAIGGGE